MKRVPLVYITDREYVLPTGVAIASLISSMNPGLEYEIYVFATDDCAEYESLFLSYEQNPGIRIHFQKIGNLIDFEVAKHWYVSSIAMIKFYLPELLSEYDKYLYMDGDTLVNEDLHELLNYELKPGEYLAAVADMVAMEIESQHKNGIDVERYFNSGIMLVNAKKCREDHITEKLIKTKKENPDYPFMDQHVLNAVFAGKVSFLDPKWNAMLYNIISFQIRAAEYNAFFGTSYASYAEMEEQAAVLHLTNFYKPWYFDDTYMEKRWNKVYESSPFCEITKKKKEWNDAEPVNFMYGVTSAVEFRSLYEKAKCIFEVHYDGDNAGNLLIDAVTEEIRRNSMSSDDLLIFWHPWLSRDMLRIVGERCGIRMVALPAMAGRILCCRNYFSADQNKVSYSYYLKEFDYREKCYRQSEEIADLNIQRDGLFHEKVEFQKQNQQMEETITELREAQLKSENIIFELQAYQSKAEKTIGDLEENRKTMEVSLTAKEERCNELEVSLAAKEMSCNELEESLAAKEILCNELEKQLQDLRDSESYKIGHSLMYIPGKMKHLLKTDERGEK